MDDKFAIVFFTRPSPKESREWAASRSAGSGWGFKAGRCYALRQSSKRPEELEELQELLKALSEPSGQIVIWLDGENYKDSVDTSKVDGKKWEADMKLIIEKLKGFSILIATHGWIPSKDGINLDQVISATYSSSDNPSYKEIVLKLKDDPEFEKIFDAAWEYLKKKPLIPRISILKHRIAHCFLSIDIDLQGTMSILDKREAKEYLDEVLAEKKNSYYVERLKDARRLAGLGVVEKDEEDTIQKIVAEQKLENDRWWKYVKNLLGDPEENVSPIYPLFKELDDSSNIARDEEKTLPLIECFADLKKCWESDIKDKKWCFDECFKRLIGEKDKYSFHDWFVALDTAFERLREKISRLKHNKGCLNW